MKNKKGFTLIELLAVIIVLALIMVFSIPVMLNASNNAQIKSFQMYGERVYNLAQSHLQSTQLLNNNELDATSGVLDLSDIGLRDSSYSGCIVYAKHDVDDTGNLEYDLTINLTMTNKSLCTGTTVLSAANNLNISTTTPVSSSCPASFVKSTNNNKDICEAQ